MITFIQGDLFSAKTDSFAHGVNAVGKMDAGIALEFKKRYPEMYSRYKRLCDQHILLPGEVFYYGSKDERPNVVNLVTQNGLNKANIDYLELAIDGLTKRYKMWNIKKIAMPKIGCGRGGLDWEEVKSLLVNKFEKIKLEVLVYSL